MKYVSFKRIGVLVLAAGLSACAQDTVGSGQVAVTGGGAAGARNNNIDRHYLLTAAEGANQTSLFATFRMTGTWSTTVRLDPPAQLLFNGQLAANSEVMSKESAVMAGTLFPVLSPFFFLATGTHYSSTSPNRDVHTLAWTDQGGQVFTDQMKISPCSFVRADSTVNHGGFQVQIAPTNPRTEVRASLQQSKKDGSSVFASASGRGSQVGFTSSDFDRFESGTATLKIECDVDTDLNSAGSGHAVGTAVYQLTPRPVNVRL